MIRFFVWQCGTIAFVAIIWRYGYWREILPLAVLGSAFLWIVCGGILLSRGGRKGARLAHDSPVDAREKLDAAYANLARTPVESEMEHRAALQNALNAHSEYRKSESEK